MYKQINAKLKNDTARVEFWVVTGFILVTLLFQVFDIIHINNSGQVNAQVANGMQTPITYVSDPITATIFNHLIILISYLLLVFYVEPAFENGQGKASNSLFVFAFIAICFVLGIINMYFTALLALKVVVIYFNRNRQNKENGLYYETALLTACWILIVVGLFYVVTPEEVKYYALYNTSFAMLVYLYAIHGILPRLWPKRFRFLKYFGLMFLLSIVTTLMMLALTYGESQGSNQIFNQMPQEIINQLKNLSVLRGMSDHMQFVVTIGNFLTQLLIVTPTAWNIYKSRNAKKDEEIKTLKTELGKSDANLNFLKSQINPHFLFNALNTLYGTALQENAERTGEGIQKLGDMMRFMLQENTQDKILLSRDIDYLKNYSCYCAFCSL